MRRMVTRLKPAAQHGYTAEARREDGVALAMSSGSSKSKVEGADAIKDFWKSHGERAYVVEIPELRREQHGSSESGPGKCAWERACGQRSES